VDTARFFELLDAVAAPADAEYLYDEGEPLGALRRGNLRRYLDLIADGGADTILVGEAPGYRGMTVTGIPFTSVRQLDARPGLITGSADGDGFERPITPAAPWEASSAVVWRALADWRRPLPLLWSIYPHHPFVAGDPLGNRAPRPAEVRDGTPLVLELIEAFGVERVVAVGRKAEGSLAANGVDAHAIRHPAQGGAATFTRQLAEIDAARRG
jgi:uracil-DNA glycosylase